VIPSNNIRFAKESDCKQILDIYAPYIIRSAISFENQVPSLEDFKNRFKETTEKYPWLVFEEDGVILGYAYGSSHRSRCAYGWSCEVTVYVDENHHKKGIGSNLYRTLFPILKAQGFYNLFAGITQPNEGSNQVHKRMGFTEVGTYKNIGYKLSKWHDVSWYQLEINSGGVPKEPAPIEDLLTKNLTIKKIDPIDQNATDLIHSLDGYLMGLYSAEENHLDSRERLSAEDSFMLGAYLGDLLIGIGAVKFQDGYGEIKRMYVLPLFRGFGVSRKILSELEAQIKKRDINISRLETGDLQEAALALYKKSNYREVEPFGSYQENNSSLFMEKEL
jgi:L-amino acid N-acyltransferase YncA